MNKKIQKKRNQNNLVSRNGQVAIIATWPLHISMYIYNNNNNNNNNNK